VYAPVSVLPLPWPLVIQLANLAASNQLTYVIGRLPLLPPLLITLYEYEPEDKATSLL
jgi:hypothetical protein